MDDIWSTGILTFESPLKDLLESEEGYTLEDLLNQDELLQEVKGCHPQLKQFFSQEENVADLVRCLIRSPLLECKDQWNVDSSTAEIEVDTETGSSTCIEQCNESNYLNSHSNSNSNNHSHRHSDSNEEQCQHPLSQTQSMSTSSAVVIHETHINTNGDVDSESNRNSNTLNHQPFPFTLLSSSVESIRSDNTNDEEQNDDSNKNDNMNDNNNNEITTETKEEGEKNQDNNNHNLNLNSTKGSSTLAPGEWLLDQITEKVDSNSYKKPDNHNQHHDVNISSQEEYDKIYIRYPYMACEVICCENDDILDSIVYGTYTVNNNHSNDNNQDNDDDQQSILDLLFSVLYDTPPSQLDDRRAGYLEKILSLLFRKRPKVMEGYLNGDHLLEQQQQHPISNDTNNNNNDDDDDDEDDYNHNHHSIHKRGGITLLNALFNHIHSNSITQIVQRLLIPKPPPETPLNNNNNNNHESQPNSSSNSNNDDDDDNDEYDDDNLITSGMEEFGNIDCHWTDGEYAINLLLERLLGESKDDLDNLLHDNDIDHDYGHNNHNHNDYKIKNTDPLDYSSKSNGSSSSSTMTMTRFDCSQHASEILIAIIQHSTLSSNVMKMLTDMNILSQLIECSCTGEPHRKKSISSTTNSNNNTTTNDDDCTYVPQSFSRHESTMTTVMSVLETLVLQLGGYGSVPTSPFFDESDQGDGDLLTQRTSSSNEVPHDEEKDDNANNKNNANTQQKRHMEANTSSLIQLLPSLLTRLSKLLTHPDTLNWKSNMQYSNQPQLLLGASRLKIVRLIESLVLLGRREVDHILCQSECLEICLDLFWDFPWCSMLHQCVANLLVHVLEGGEERNELQYYFLYHCNLMERLMKSFCGVEGNCVNANLDRIETDFVSDNIETTYDTKVKSSNEACITSNEDDNDIPFITNEADCIPVSDDDVDAALEQEELEKLNGNIKDEIISNNTDKSDKTDLDLGTTSCNDEKVLDVTNHSNPIVVEEPANVLSFRIGYMGHVIIICQALVHACGVQESQSNMNSLNISTQEQDDNGGLVTSTSELNGAGDDTVEQCVVIQATNATNNIMDLVRNHSLYSQWLEFVTSTLASETAVQSTPLGGGCNTQGDSNIMDESISNGEIINDHEANVQPKGTYIGEINDGDFDVDNKKFDDTEIDIAAGLMDSIYLPEEGGGSHGNGSHHRRKGVLGGGGSGTDSGAAFGTVVQMHQSTGDYYQYDDPLGQWQDRFPDDMAFDCKGFGDSNSDDNDNDNDNDVPVMDLFTGNLNFGMDNQNNDTAWANFDEGFAECTANGDTQIIDSSPDPFEPDLSSFAADDGFSFGTTSNFDAAFGDDDEQITTITSSAHHKGNLDLIDLNESSD
jgi:hypothetical protein